MGGHLRRPLRGEAPLIMAGLVGAVLRLDQITLQIVGDDEWHGLRTALYRDYGWVLTHFGVSDHSIPLTARVIGLLTLMIVPLESMAAEGTHGTRSATACQSSPSPTTTARRVPSRDACSSAAPC